MIENHRSTCDLAQRRQIHEERERTWSDEGRPVRTIYELPEGRSLERYFIATLGWGLLAFRNVKDETLSFFRAPPAASHKQAERWMMHPFNHSLDFFAVYPPDNILVVAQKQEQWVPSPLGEHSATDCGQIHLDPLP